MKQVKHSGHALLIGEPKNVRNLSIGMHQGKTK